jgi:hypothetical protein
MHDVGIDVALLLSASQEWRDAYFIFLVRVERFACSINYY